MNSLALRLLAAFSANSFGRITTTLIQLVSVPVLLSHWGSTLYGEWILLNTIPAYFSMSDLGFGTVAGNEMTMLMATKRAAEALEVFQSVWVITTCLSSAAAVLLLTGIWFVPLDRWLHLRVLTVNDMHLIVLFLALSVLLGMQESLFQAAFRCEGHYAYGTAMKSVIVLASFASTLVSVLLGMNPRWVAITYLFTNAIGTVVLFSLLRRKIPWIRFGVQFARLSTIRRLTSPAISLMCFPIANALSMQGSVAVIGYVLGPTSVVVFNTARTISRSAYQVMNLINNSVWPEISAAFGSDNLGLARGLHRRACQLSVFLCLCISLVVAVCGPYVWKLWTVGKIITDPTLLNIMMMQLLVSSLWFTSSVVPLAINKHQRLAKLLVCTAMLSLVLGWLSMTRTTLGLRGVAAGLVIADIITALYVVRASLKLLNDTVDAFWKSMLTLPRGGQRRFSDAYSSLISRG
jgi:O-antigen/teichoic acid export membrane protein